LERRLRYRNNHLRQQRSARLDGRPVVTMTLLGRTVCSKSRSLLSKSGGRRSSRNSRLVSIIRWHDATSSLGAAPLSLMPERHSTETCTHTHPNVAAEMRPSSRLVTCASHSVHRKPVQEPRWRGVEMQLHRTVPDSHSDHAHTDSGRPRARRKPIEKQEYGNDVSVPKQAFCAGCEYSARNLKNTKVHSAPTSSSVLLRGAGELHTSGCLASSSYNMLGSSH
jgi:hypothetical protein